MQRHTFRTILIYLVLIVAAIYIYPTVGWMLLSPEERQARLERWDEEDMTSGDRGLFGEMWHGVQRWAEFDRDMVINLGLDLQGGVHMVVGFDMSEEAEARELEQEQVQEMVLQRIRNRIDEFEAKEPLIQALGDNQVQVQLPGEKDVERAQQLIMRTAFLTFHVVAGPEETNRVLRKVHEHFDETSGRELVPFLEPRASRGGPYRVMPENYDRVYQLLNEANEVEGLLPENREFAFSPPPKPGAEQEAYRIYLIESEPEMTGEHLAEAVARPDNQSPGYWTIMFSFDGEGSSQFADVTEANIDRQLAILLDERVVSAPTIQERIFGEGSISGNFGPDEAQDLAIALNSGSMPVPIHLDYMGVVGATLGADSVSSGVRSALIGLALVMVFMVVYYRTGGVIANVALVSNALFVVGALAYFGATLTLPGIAGLILTIGMAVDANVLIFERIREELRNGKSLAASVEGGFGRATVTILDANITTLIAAAVLTQFGTGPVQGFAVTLSIGVCASVFAALVVTRAVLDFLVERNLISNLSMLSIVPADSQWRFLNKRRYAAIASVVVIGIGVAVFAGRGQQNFGVDFTNGTNMEVAINASEAIPVGAVRDRLAEAGFDSPAVQEFQLEGDELNNFMIRVGEISTGDDPTAPATSSGDDAEASEGGGDSVAARTATVDDRVREALVPLSESPGTENLDEAVELLRVETVGPAVGQRLQRDALAAVTYALLFIVAYLWFRFELKFAMGAVVALAHDVLVTLGVFAVAQREITIPVVAAILTIIGYSLNDTIIVYDRIREDIKLYKGKGFSFSRIMDLSVNQTLSRTLITSLTTLFVVVVLFLFGGAAINDFAFALIIGIIVGTYSSIFVASPVVLLWEKWRGRMTIDDLPSEESTTKPGKPGGEAETDTAAPV